MTDATVSLEPGAAVPGLPSPYRHERPEGSDAPHADHVPTAAHETRGHLLWTDHGARPYWTLSRAFMSFDAGSRTVQLELPTWRDPSETRTWSVTLSYHHSGMDPRPSDDVEQLYEFDVNAQAEEERKLPLIVQPRLGWDECPDRRPQSVPDDLGEATNVRVNNATNLELDQVRFLVPLLFRGLLEALGESWNRRFFAGEPHPHSRVTQHERYVRVSEEYGSDLSGSTGVLRRMFDLAAETEGSRVEYHADNRERKNWRHEHHLDPGATAEVFGDATGPDLPAVGHQEKVYYPKHTGDRGEGDPLNHPKLGLLFKSGLNGGEAIPWHDRHQLIHALETYTLNILSWGGVPTKPGTWWPDGDWHFSGDRYATADRQVTLLDDPLPEIETRQETRIVSALTALEESDRDVLQEVVATDGGTPVAEIEATTGWSSSTIYRVLSRLGSLLENDTGSVSFVSGKIRDECRAILSRLDRAVDASAATLERILGMDGRDLDRRGKAWQKWVNKYAAELVEGGARDGGDVLRLRSLLADLKSQPYPLAEDALADGLAAWIDSGRPPGAFPSAVEYETPDGSTHRRTLEQLRRRLRGRRARD